MPKPYKIEVFDRSFAFRAFSVAESQPIYFDYLTLEKTKLKVPRLDVQKGDFLHITDFDGNVIYQGVADDVKTNKQITTVAALPLLSLFDVAVPIDRALLQNGTLEGFIAKAVSDTYITNADDLQNIHGLTVSTLTQTQNAKLNIKSNVHQLYDIITKALTNYGVVVNVQMHPQQKNIAVSIGAAAEKSVTIETSLKKMWLQKAL